MKHLNDFSSFLNEEHVYKKAMAKDSQNWKENYKKLIEYVRKEMINRQLSDFKDDGEIITFKIRGRKYKVDRDNKICIYNETAEGEEEVELDLTQSQLEEFISILKTPIKSERRKAKGQGKPYIEEEEGW